MGETRFIVAGYCIDGSGAGVRKNVCLTVREGRIAAVGAATKLPRHDGVVAIDDLSHCTIVPALVDCSVVLARSPAIDPRMRTLSEAVNVEQQVALFERHIRYCHAHGVLGVADSDAPADLLERYSGETALERSVIIRTSGRVCRSENDYAVGNCSGRDFLKIGYSPDIDAEEAPSFRLGQEDLRHILLHHQGGKSVVVANGRQAVAEALAVGCDAIEQGYRMGEDNLRTMAEQQVLWIPSLLRAKNGLDSSASGGEVCCRFSQRYVAPGKPIPGAEAFWRETLADQLAQLRRAHALGVPTAVGTGAGSTGILHGESVVEEMKLFIKAGYSLEEAIRCASVQGAGFFGMNDLGPLTIGQRATFLVTRGTPQQLPRKLAYLENVYIEGAPSSAYRKNPVRAKHDTDQADQSGTRNSSPIRR